MLNKQIFSGLAAVLCTAALVLSGCNSSDSDSSKSKNSKLGTPGETATVPVAVQKTYRSTFKKAPDFTGEVELDNLEFDERYKITFGATSLKINRDGNDAEVVNETDPVYSDTGLEIVWKHEPYRFHLSIINNEMNDLNVFDLSSGNAEFVGQFKGPQASTGSNCPTDIGVLNIQEQKNNGGTYNGAWGREDPTNFCITEIIPSADGSSLEIVGKIAVWGGRETSLIISEHGDGDISKFTITGVNSFSNYTWTGLGRGWDKANKTLDLEAVPQPLGSDQSSNNIGSISISGKITY